MKKKISLFLLALIMLSFTPNSLADSNRARAYVSSQKIELDGTEVNLGSYLIQGNNYMKLRDIAALLSGRESNFNVGFDKNNDLVILELSQPYKMLSGDLQMVKECKSKVLLRDYTILVNGTRKQIKAALIHGNNYVRLRDLGSIVGFGVDFDHDSKTVLLNSSLGCDVADNNDAIVLTSGDTETNALNNWAFDNNTDNNLNYEYNDYRPNIDYRPRNEYRAISDHRLDNDNYNTNNNNNNIQNNAVLEQKSGAQVKYISKKETKAIKPSEPIIKNFVSNEDLLKIKSFSDYERIISSFESFTRGKKQLSDGTFIIKEARDGEVGGLYDVAVDIVTGKELSSYKKTLIKSINIPAENEERIKLNIRLGETKTSQKVYEYVGDKSLRLGEKKVLYEAQEGEAQSIVLDNGIKIWIPSGNNKAIRGKIAVGNCEILRETLKCDYEIKNNEYAFEDSVIIPEGYEGKDGIHDAIYEYEIDPETGKLGDRKLISSKVIKEAIKGEKWVGILKRTGYKAPQGIIDGALKRLNEVRRQNGLNELWLDTSKQNGANDSAGVIVARDVQLGKRGHIYSGYDSSIIYLSMNDDFNRNRLSDEKIGCNAVDGFMSDEPHKAIMLRQANKVIIAAHCYDDGTACVVTISPKD